MSYQEFVTSTSQRRVDVTGADRVEYLDNVTTQRLADVPIASHRSALVLDPHGQPLAMLDVVVLGDRLVLLVPDDASAEFAVGTLGGRTFLMDVRFEATADRVVAVRGDEPSQRLAELGLGIVDGRCRLAGDVLIVPRQGGADLCAPPALLDEIVGALEEAGVRRGDAQDLERWRIDAGVPAWGREVTPPHLPEEAGVLPTHVHLAKGCYPGQEAVARMWMLGRPRRRLALVDTDGTIESGTELGEGRRAVTVTSVHPDGDRALAFVPGDATPGDVVASGPDVTVRALIGDDAPPGHEPAVRRRRDARAVATPG